MWLLLTSAALAAAPSLEAAAGPCGAWSVTVAAAGRGRVAFSVDGDVKAEWKLKGEGRWEVQGAGRPGERLRLEAAHRGAVANVGLDLPPPQASIAVSPLQAVVKEGHEPRFDVVVTTPCALETLSWAAVARQSGARREGAFLGSGQAWFVLPTEARGTYDVDVTLLGAGGQPIDHAAVTVQVEGP